MKRYGRWARFDEMTWPLPEVEEDGVEWRLRYGTPTREDLLVAASYMHAYSSLVCSTQKERNKVVACLRFLLTT